jgi:DNA processing protein
MTALRTALGASLRPQIVERIDRSSLKEAFAAANASVADYKRAGVELITFFDERYPERLRQIENPPPMLFVRGNVALLSSVELVAVVGTREPTNFGISAARFLTEALGRDGCGIVSGLAKGIDTVAHTAAVEIGAPTIAVLGGGLERIYPAENKTLANQIIDSGGTLISEQAFGVPPRPNHLIARDRIQSGLVAAVLIVQSGVQSGTMHTARYAASQGKPIFCPVPHSGSGANEGLRVLLDAPANELCRLLPAWKSAHKLCLRLPDRPLARPVSRDRTEGFVESVRESIRTRDLRPDCDALLTLPIE